MPATPVIAIFDIGKTNKKLFLFDEAYTIVLERSACFEEIADEDGFPCEELQSIEQWIHNSLQELSRNDAYDIKAVNFSAYGASLVYLGEDNKPILPLYNYLKPYPKQWQHQFYQTYGGEELVSFSTASPVLGSLNSGMQLYRLKYERPPVFRMIKQALHLPQYLSYLLSGQAYSEMTSIGCHTNLWDFKKMDYHEWVYREGIAEKLPPILASDALSGYYAHGQCKVGAGIHDSSAALVPYMETFREPFVLISTGTWCISLNPFNHSGLSKKDLQQDCLCYLNYMSKPVKAARLFAGNYHDENVKRMAAYYQLPVNWYQSIDFDEAMISNLKKRDLPHVKQHDRSPFPERELSCFSSPKEAYHQLMIDLISCQAASLLLVLKDAPVKQIFVDGGFSKNLFYMRLLAAAFPGMQVFAASTPQSTALGAALVLHRHWNEKELPGHLIQQQRY